MEHLILLHGALGSKDQMQPLATTLANSYQVHSFNFSGHGGKPLPAEPFSIPRFSEEISSFMYETGIEQAHLFGYSMGGYAAMYLAKQQPQKVMSLITLATKFHWDENTAAKEVSMLDGKVIQEKVPAFALQLQQRHAPVDWLHLLHQSSLLLTGLGKANALQPADYTNIATPCLLLLGDRDKMVTLEETRAVFKQLPQAQMGILPGTPHPLEQANTAILTQLITNFISSNKPRSVTT